MHPDYRQIIIYIEQHLKSGMPEARIREHLQNHGWNQEQIDKSFTEHSKLHATEFTEDHIKTQPFHHPKKYTFFDVLSDITKAILANPLAYIVCVGIITIAYFSCIAGVIFLLLLSPSPITLVAMVLLVSLTVNSYQAFMLSIMSSLLDSMYSRQKLAVLKPILLSFATLKRITLANLLTNLVCFAPFIVIALLFMLPISTLNTSSFNVAVLLLMSIMAVVGILWFLIFGLRFSLSAVVAQHEPNITIRHSLTRSKKLLGTRGQWLIVLGIAVSTILFGVLLNSDSESLIVIILQTLGVFTLVSYMFGGLAAIYFNRAAQNNK